MANLRPVILSGGSGTRLWPISSPDLPKQFVPIFGGRSLFGHTLARVGPMQGAVDPIVISGVVHQSLVDEELARADLAPAQVLLEPVGRNTAPAVVAAALVSHADDVLVILPSDHLVADDQEFQSALLKAADLAKAGHVVTFGIAPNRPETGYGYIARGAETGSGFAIESFVEKPPLEIAKQLITTARHYWNSGMFVATATSILGEAERSCPDVLKGVRAAVGSMNGRVLGESFHEVESISFDHAIMEHTSVGALVELDAGWTDLGSYRALLEALDTDENGNYTDGEVVAQRVSGSYLSTDGATLAVADVEDMVVVARDGAVLVVPIDKSQAVRDIVSELNAG